MTTITATRPSRRRLAGLALLAGVAVVAPACQGTWGLRASYRTYVTGPMGQGEITAQEGATWLDGPGTGKGPFQWELDWSTWDAGTETGTVQFRGGVTTAAHPSEDGDVLDTSVWNPRLEITGDVGTLYVDLAYRPFDGPAPEELPALAAATNVAFATVDLSGEDLTPAENGNITISEAPTTGITAAMELIGWDDFYGDPVVLDPFSVTFNDEIWAPAIAPTPRVVVSRTEGLRAGDTVIVWGTGFDPDANTGTRPPLSGQASGVYAVFGKFVSPWQPSAGAPSTNRTVVAQRWALPPTSRAVLDPAGTNPAFVEIDELGRFTATLTIGESAAAGAYGVYTYPGSGAVNAAHELAVPVTLAS